MAVKKTLVTKSHIFKTDDEKRLAFGIFSVAKVGDDLVKDAEGDEIDPDVIEKAAYGHVLNARVAGDTHLRKGVGNLVESMVFTPEKCEAIVKALAETGITASIDIPAVVWWGGYHVHDDKVWKAVKDGEYVSFSIGGTANRIEDDA